MKEVREPKIGRWYCKWFPGFEVRGEREVPIMWIPMIFRELRFMVIWCCVNSKEDQWHIWCSEAMIRALGATLLRTHEPLALCFFVTHKNKARYTAITCPVLQASLQPSRKETEATPELKTCMVTVMTFTYKLCSEILSHPKQIVTT